jgi:hypothetical protein
MKDRWSKEFLAGIGEHHRVAKTIMHDDEQHRIFVSTVKLPLDLPDGECYETMVFKFNGEAFDYQRRYAFEEDALEGHAETVIMYEERGYKIVAD